MKVETDKSGLVQIVYRGPRKGGFQVVAGVTRTRYEVPGQGKFVLQSPGGVPGVKPPDVGWFRAVAQGRDFQIVVAPSAAPTAPPAQAPAPAPPPAPVEEARKPVADWAPGIMEPKAPPPLVEVDVPDLQSLTVAEVKELEIGPGLVDLLLVQEREGKGRKTVLDYLERLAE